MSLLLSLCFQPLHPAGPGHLSGAACVTAGEESGMCAGSQPGQGCGTRWGCGSLIPLFPAAPGSLGLLAEASQSRAGASVPAVLSPCLYSDEAAAASS